MEHIPIIILGGGPAGLSLGHELAQHDLPYKIFERAPEVGNTFYKMTDSTEYGPWINNTLPGSPVSVTDLFARTTRSEYARYLSQYRNKHNLNVATCTSVISATKSEDGFDVETNRGMYSCRVLVNATGYFSNPFIPDYPGLQESELVKLHSAEYVSPFTIAEALGKPTSKTLIVGCRLSAGEIMEELHKAGHTLHLSHRNKIRYWPSPVEETIRSPFTMAWERIALQLRAPKPANLKPRLRRGFQKTLLDQGVVKKHPNIKAVHGKIVEFTDGHREEFEVILFATGYQAALSHLWPLLGSETPKVSKVECKAHKNLFLLGYENARNFRSQFLRGIRADAKYLGELLRERISSFNTIHVKTRTTQILSTASPVERSVSAEQSP